jgi:hypothetical protein
MDRLSKGYESAETDTRLRQRSTYLCEAYACAEFAVVNVGGVGLCEFHRHEDPRRATAKGPIEEPSP